MVLRHPFEKLQVSLKQEICQESLQQQKQIPFDCDVTTPAKSTTADQSEGLHSPSLLYTPSAEKESTADGIYDSTDKANGDELEEEGSELSSKQKSETGKEDTNTYKSRSSGQENPTIPHVAAVGMTDSDKECDDATRMTKEDQKDSTLFTKAVMDDTKDEAGQKANGGNDKSASSNADVEVAGENVAASPKSVGNNGKEITGAHEAKAGAPSVSAKSCEDSGSHETP